MHKILNQLIYDLINNDFEIYLLLQNKIYPDFNPHKNLHYIYLADYINPIEVKLKKCFKPIKCNFMKQVLMNEKQVVKKIFPEISKVAKIIQGIGNLFKLIKPEFFAAYSDTSIIDRSLFYTAKKQNVKSVLIFHAISHGHFMLNNIQYIQDIIFVQSLEMKKQLNKRKDVKSKIYSVNTPLYDEYLKIKNDKNLSYQRLRLRVDKTYIAIPIEICDDFEWRKTRESFKMILESLKNEKSNIELLLKSRSILDDETENFFETLAKSYNVICHYYNDNLADILNISKILICDVTSILYESVLFDNICCICLKRNKEKFYFENNYYHFFVKNQIELNEAIKTILHDEHFLVTASEKRRQYKALYFGDIDLSYQSYSSRIVDVFNQRTNIFNILKNQIKLNINNVFSKSLSNIQFSLAPNLCKKKSFFSLYAETSQLKLINKSAARKKLLVLKKALRTLKIDETEKKELQAKIMFHLSYTTDLLLKKKYYLQRCIAKMPNHQLANIQYNTMKKDFDKSRI